MSLFARLRAFRKQPITGERFADLSRARPKRVSFRELRQLQRGTSGPAVGFFKVNFAETIQRFFPWSLERLNGEFGPYHRRVIRTEFEYENIRQWLEENGDLVFIRSLLDTCLAVSEHQSSPGVRTAVGELEYLAKSHKDRDAQAKLIDVMELVYRRLYPELELDAICAVPSSRLGAFSLPSVLASELARRLGLEDITARVRWAGPKPSMKTIDVDDKWNELEKVGLEVEAGLTNRKLLIIDDLYQSGATVHYVASRLEAAGASETHCLAVVKSLRDTDNS